MLERGKGLHSGIGQIRVKSTKTKFLQALESRELLQALISYPGRAKLHCLQIVQCQQFLQSGVGDLPATVEIKRLQTLELRQLLQPFVRQFQPTEAVQKQTSQVRQASQLLQTCLRSRKRSDVQDFQAFEPSQ